MNKKLIAAALAALPVAAMADVTIYGKMIVGLESNKDNRTASAVSQTNLDDYGSRIGFKGNEDLGNGLKAIWQVENAVKIDGNSDKNTFATRQSFLGLTGSFGTVKAGLLNNGAKDQGIIDPNNYNNANGLVVFTRTGKRLSHSLRYDTPDLSGFTATGMYSFGENAASGVSSTDIYNLALNYKTGPYEVHYAYQQERNPGSQADGVRSSASWHHAEAVYNDGTWIGGLGWQRTKGYGYTKSLATAAFAQNGVTTNEWALYGAYVWGNWKAGLTYARGGDASDNTGASLNDSGYSQYILTADYNLSKRTYVEASYGNIKWGASNSVAAASYTGNSTGTSQNQRTLGLSLYHVF